MTKQIEKPDVHAIWKNHAGLKEESVGWLAEYFAELDKLSTGLTGRTLRYILDGEGPEALNELVANRLVPGQFLRFQKNPWQEDDSLLQGFFETLESPSPELLMRLGQVLDSALPKTPVFILSHAFDDTNLGWLNTLLRRAFELENSWPPHCKECRAMTAELVESMLVLAGHPPELLILAAFQPEIQNSSGSELEPVFEKLRGLAALAMKYKSVIVSALTHKDFRQRLYALQMLRKCQAPPVGWVEQLTALALSSSKQAQESAEALLRNCVGDARALLEQRLLDGRNPNRIGMVNLLWRLAGEETRPFLQTLVVSETNKKVIKVIQSLVESTETTTPSPLSRPLELPPLPPISGSSPLSLETKKAWLECFEKVRTGVDRLLAKPGPARFFGNLKIPDSEEIEVAFSRLQEGIPAGSKPSLDGMVSCGWTKEIDAPVKEFWKRPELEVIHLARFLVELGSIPIANDKRHVLSYGFWMESLFGVFHAVHPEVGLREMAHAFESVGIDSSRIGLGLLDKYDNNPFPLGLPPAQIWPYWSEHLDLLESAFETPQDGFLDRWDKTRERANAFHALATFPVPPPKLVPLLWKLALGPKRDRMQAQRCLENLPDKPALLIDSLQAAASEARGAAATWLGKCKNPAAIEPLVAALKKEKNEAAKYAMILALEQLGAPIDQFMNRDALSKEAQTALAKGTAAGLEWFPIKSLPAVHWADSGQAVEVHIIQWWLAQAFKLKSPEPGVLLRKYCAMLIPSEREALGESVLAAWIAQDTMPIPRAEAEKRARQNAQSMLQWTKHLNQQAQQNPQTHGVPVPPLTLEEYYAKSLLQMLREPVGSAIDSKGILALAGACVGGRSTLIVSRYLKDWYGQRAAQCRALIQMLAWVEHRTATQLLLAVGARFRTRSIQEEALRQAQALAERKGWTVADLADRTIPNAGLDEHGVLTLDYGPRQFTARLGEGLELNLFDSDGKSIKALPEPRKEDDSTLAAEAKKTLSAMKKELKSVVSMQRDRFYEAMCTEHSWSFGDWNLYLNRHSVVGRLTQRLAWSQVRDGKPLQWFRPLPDGTLTNEADEPVVLDDADVVQIAHECSVPPEKSTSWRHHFADYEVEPLFEQFGRERFQLPENKRNDAELADFQGCMIEAFKLRGRATKLGYTRGQTQDGGWFQEYVKRFPTLNIQTAIGFTGNSLPEENRAVALTTLSFQRFGADGTSNGMTSELALSEVPVVLLGECWNDMRQIASEGLGFDPEWEKKTTL